MRISDWSSDVCSSDLPSDPGGRHRFLLAVAARSRAFLDRRAQRPRAGDSGAASRDLPDGEGARGAGLARGTGDRKDVVWGQSVAVRVDLGGRRIIKKKNK